MPVPTLDQFTGGRLGVHFISGGSDDEQKRDGDYLDHDQRYARTDEYLDVLKRVWTETQPFDHEGQFYRFERGFLHPGEAPGLGVDIDETLAATFPYERAYLPVERLTDGTMHDW